MFAYMDQDPELEKLHADRIAALKVRVCVIVLFIHIVISIIVCSLQYSMGCQVRSLGT